MSLTFGVSGLDSQARLISVFFGVLILLIVLSVATGIRTGWGCGSRNFKVVIVGFRMGRSVGFFFS